MLSHGTWQSAFWGDRQDKRALSCKAAPKNIRLSGRYANIEFVPVRVSKVTAVEVSATSARSPFVSCAKLKCEGMDGVDMIAVAGSERNHSSVAI